ncbi:uncharacterized protein [Spinacia oleracea]|uniref:Reverse transcriptase zinc-binding domain-containing protein n=1 Tax=Spinacia oleracea TaxID=3562 RepID=A0ABM3R7Z6_SPIOL|nr:uncharacterized protein LOC130467301 [Spinacia oleracea]
MGKHVWLITKKKENIWVQWIHSVYLKGKPWWDYSPKNDDSWYWRDICQIKEMMKQHITENQLMAISKYSIKKVYLKLMGSAPVQYWTNAVWGRLGHPKHRFIIWLALLGRLNTKDRLLKIGVTTDNTCLLCGIAVEDHRHLFSGCPFSVRCWQQIGS